MKVLIGESIEDINIQVSEMIIDRINNKPDLNISLATGKTMVGIYNELVNAYNNSDVSFKDVTTFNLDEYLDISYEDSFYHYMDQNLFNKVDISKDNINFLNDTNKEEFKKALLEHPIDLQILGLGINGHIGFNEPGTPFDTTVHETMLTRDTLEANKNDIKNKLPDLAITMGIQDIMNAKEIILVAYGENKANAIKKMLEDNLTKMHPVSILVEHPNVTVVIDEKAASLLE